MLESKYNEIAVTARAIKGNQIRNYDTYSEFLADFRFFWSGGLPSEFEDSAESHFNRIINILLEINENGTGIKTCRSGLEVIFTHRKYK